MRSANLRTLVTTAAMLAACLLTPIRADAQVDCWAPREQQNSVTMARFAPIRQTLLTIEDIIRKNSAYQAAPEPVRMRTTISAGPDEKGGAQIFVRAYPPVQTTANIQIWTKDRCDVIPQAERVAASVGQIYAFVNYHVREQFLGGNEVPKYEGEFAGYPIYNGWIVITKDRRLPWIPQTLGDRLARAELERQRALDDWNKTKAERRLPDEAASMKTYDMLKQMDPAGAEKFLAAMRETAERVRQAKAAEPRTDAHLRGHLKAVQDYRASFSRQELNSPAVWMDKNGDGRKRLDATIAELQKLPPRQGQVDPMRAREIRQAHIEDAFFSIQDARADYELTNLKPGAKEDAMAFKPDPTFPDFTDPFRPQSIIVTFWSKSDPKDNSARTLWLRNARATFDFAALAALLR